MILNRCRLFRSHLDIAERRHVKGETESQYAKALGVLAYYVYKDDTQAHIDQCCRPVPGTIYVEAALKADRRLTVIVLQRAIEGDEPGQQGRGVAAYGRVASLIAMMCDGMYLGHILSTGTPC